MPHLPNGNGSSAQGFLCHGRLEFFVDVANALFKRGLGGPAEGGHFGNVKQLSRRAVGLGGVPRQGTLEAHHAGDGLGEPAHAGRFVGFRLSDSLDQV